MKLRRSITCGSPSRSTSPGGREPGDRSPAPPHQHGYLLSERDEEFNQHRRPQPPGQDVIRNAELVAKSKSTVLITGETAPARDGRADPLSQRAAQMPR
jgi:hypothetical protein